MWEQRWHPASAGVGDRGGAPPVAAWSGGEVAARRWSVLLRTIRSAICVLVTTRQRQGNPAYTGTYVFDNDHPCVGPEAPRDLGAPPWLYRNAPADGIARVVCYSPRHDITLAELDVDGVDALLATWQDQYRELRRRPEVAYVLIFENKGEVVGVSQPASALPDLRDELRLQVHRDRAARRRSGIARRRDACSSRTSSPPRGSDGRRILGETGSAIAFVPVLRALRRTRSSSHRRARTRPWPTSTPPSAATSPTVLRDTVDSVRQPVEDAVPVRDGPASGADRRRRRTTASTSTSSSTRRCGSRTC